MHIHNFLEITPLTKLNKNILFNLTFYNFFLALSYIFNSISVNTILIIIVIYGTISV